MSTLRAYLFLSLVLAVMLLHKLLEENISGIRMASISPSMSMFLNATPICS